MSVTVTIGIKALNEEAHIAKCLASACAAAEPFGGEVILADSGSSDRTVEIAQGFPVRIVQLSDPAQRSCGTGAQLAFQEAHGEFFYLLDGDMVLSPEMIAQGIAFLRANPDYAAVGGRVNEANTNSIEFELRAQSDAQKGSRVSGEVDRLDCGGLYRTEAVRAAGYFADRNLHAFEEFELGARLRARGWKLARIPVDAVDHYGHVVAGYKLMLRRLRSGYAGGPGEVVRAALGQPHFAQVARDFAQLRYGVVIYAWWLAMLLAVATGQWLALAIVVALPIAYFAWRRGGLRLGLYSLATWNVNAIGLIQGFLRPRRPAAQAIPRRDVSGKPRA
ncbi:glycosyltransferase involved in cell wall biosynthesis [Novosphingobium chloroacetimidivorans]|uniref:Glycosyltransferase involved in cell wall biosynthesis n=1 Tax=Novosphingobium chloroacetimidivorans TaxID=1428314 RepID=A0A7W7K6T8_9SPHN|nr:glycosyltransferase [Novosphingobium chloroacetimidivorans]MBB4857246.1 glycosyltransferase involved in cell wall biosynthesis [Novosphingobium chloroacetimidivorans]